MISAKKENIRRGILGFLAVTGLTLTSGGLFGKASAVKAEAQTDSIVMTGFANGTASSYVTTLTTGTSTGGLSVSACNYNPKTGQIRGNQTRASTNFYLYNNEAVLGNITKIELTTTSSGSFSTGMYISVGQDSQADVTTVTDGIQGTKSTDSKTITWTFSEMDGYTYFKMLSAAKFTSGTVSAAVVNIEYSTETKYTVTLNADGGECESSELITEEGKVVLPTPTKEGYAFKGWKEENTETVHDAGEFVPTENITLIAQWELITTPTITVSLDDTVIDSTIKVGSSGYIHATLLNAASVTENDIVWTSSDPEVATFDANEFVIVDSEAVIVLKGLKSGTTTISAEMMVDGQKYVSNAIDLTVVHPVEEIETLACLGVNYASRSVTYTDESLNFAGSQSFTGSASKNSVEDVSGVLPSGMQGGARLEYCTNDSINHYLNSTSGFRLYKDASLNGGSLKFTLTDVSVKSLTVDASNYGYGTLILDGTSSALTEGAIEIPAGTKEIVIQNTGTDRLDISGITLTYDAIALTCTDARLRFGFTLPSDLYDLDKISAVGVALTVNNVQKEVELDLEENKTVNEDGSSTYITALTGIPVEAWTTDVTATPYVILDSVRYDLETVTWSVSSLVDHYLQNGFADNAVLNAMKAQIQ